MTRLVKKFIVSLAIFFLASGVFLAVVVPIVVRKNNILGKHRNKYNVVLSVKYGYLDKGFNQQAIEGVCLAFQIKPNDCNGKNKLFREGKISYGYSGTFDSVSLIKEYVDNFAETENTNFFVMPGFTYEAFLRKWLFDNREYFQKKNINFISVGTAIFTDPQKWPKNFWQVLFEEYLPGYYAGLYAGAYALMNPEQFKDGNPKQKGKQIHFAALGGLWIPPITRYALGFKLGISEINKNRDRFTDTNTEVLFTQYETTGSFDNTSQSKFDTARLFRSGVSVVFSIAVSLTIANQAAAKEEDTSAGKEQHWIVGVDIDQGLTVNNEDANSAKLKGKILVSAILKIKEYLADLIQKINRGEESAAPITVKSSDYLSIPQRFKARPEWKKVQEVIFNGEENAEPTSEIMQAMRNWTVQSLSNNQVKAELLKFLNDPTRTVFPDAQLQKLSQTN